MRNIIKYFKKFFWNPVFADMYKNEILRQIELQNQQQYRYFKALQYRQKVNFYQQRNTSMDDTSVSTTPVFDKELIISVTTFGKRINTVWATIESLMYQSIKPNRITLWISEDYKNVQLPLSLQHQISRGLEIHYIEDVRSFTKLVPALLTYPDSYILTVDDDYLYPYDFIERFVMAHTVHENSICCLEARHMIKNSDGTFMSFNSFPRIFEMPDDNMKYYMPEGFAGVLYPPHSLHNDVVKKELFLKLCPTNDDLWFKIMSLLNNTDIYIISNYMDLFSYITINPEMQENALCTTNETGAFDEQLQKVLNYYHLK